MDILKLSQDWARAELFSAKMAWLFSVIVLITAIGFSYWGKTAMAKAFVIPLIVSAVLLVAIGAGLYFSNQPRIERFEKEYKSNAQEFIQKEIERTAKSENDFKVVFKVLPLIIVVAVGCLLFFSSPNWRAISISVILLMAFLMLLDSNTSARNEAYHKQLLQSK